MLKLIDFVIIAVNIILAAYYLSELRRVSQREKELLATMETWEACRNAEVKAVMGWSDGASWEKSNAETKREICAYAVEIWRN